MDDTPTYIVLERNTHRPVRIDTIVAARMKRLLRMRRRQMRRQRRRGR